jgi:O-6-methylguanine DNA methyltransferase
VILASQLRAGMAIKFEGSSYKVMAAEYHPGQGKMGGAAHVRLQNTVTGTFWEHSFRSDLKLEDIAVEKRPLEFLYDDDDHCWFMNPENYEQTAIVWDYLRSIPYGQVQSYGDVAAGIGKPSAVRAVARVCAANRVALVISCHRVIRGTGAVGGYRWGLERKRALLDRERA